MILQVTKTTQTFEESINFTNKFSRQEPSATDDEQISVKTESTPNPRVPAVDLICG